MPLKIISSFFFLFASALISIIGVQNSSAQNVVVSEYMNYTTAIGVNAQYNEWTELLVIGDNVDIRNYSIRDNNNGQTSWQPQVNFNNIPFWQHMRAGTIIVLRHRCTNVGGTPYVLDTDPSDGYLELCLENTFYFNGGTFGGGLDNTMNIASGGDIIQLRNSSGNHVHALSHKSTPASSWTSMPCPKINHASGLLNGESVRITPGSTLNDFGIGGSCISGVAYTAVSAVSSLGLANSATNKNFWRFLREPSFSPATITPTTVIAGTPGSITFTWTPAFDPYPTDGVVKYLIIRNTFSFFGTPQDGTTYTVGQAMGFGSSVVGIVNSSTINTFTDNTVMNGQPYYYRVFAYRYGIDNFNGNSYANERGSAYGTPSVLVNWPFTSPLPVELISFSGNVVENKVVLNWSTATEINNDFFTVERSKDSNAFEPIGFTKGAGNSNHLLIYKHTDEEPLNGVNYYRLKQTDFNGDYSFSKTIQVDLTQKGQKLIHSLFPNPATDFVILTLNYVNQDKEISIYDITGKSVGLYSKRSSNEASIQWNISDLPNGVYFVKVKTDLKIQVTRLIKSK